MPKVFYLCTMEKQKITLSTLESKDDNPFISKLFEESGYIKPNSIVVKEDTEWANIEDGDVMSLKTDRGKRRHIWTDTGTFCKYFNSQYAFGILINLSHNARNLLDYIGMTLPINSAFISIDVKTYLESVGKSPKSKDTYYNAALELCEKDVLAKKTNTTFYVNPLIVFNGKRENLIEKDPKNYFKEYIDPKKSIFKRVGENPKIDG